MGRHQFSLIGDPITVRWAEWWLQRYKNHEFIFGGTRHEYSKMFKLVCTVLGIANFGFVPSSFRSGGATEHFRKFRNLGRTQYAGRWRNPRTLEIYLQEAMASLIQNKFDAAAIHLITQARNLYLYLAHPTSISAQELVP